METKKPESYKEALAELEAILRKMESDSCDIDSLTAQTSRALELLQYCKDKLFKTDEEISRCLANLQ